MLSQYGILSKTNLLLLVKLSRKNRQFAPRLGHNAYSGKRKPLINGPLQYHDVAHLFPYAIDMLVFHYTQT